MINSIASERTRMGLSQTQLAEKLGRKRATIARWESDPQSVSGSTLCELSDFFDCSVDYLLGRTDERIPLMHVRANR